MTITFRDSMRDVTPPARVHFSIPFDGSSLSLSGLTWSGAMMLQMQQRLHLRMIQDHQSCKKGQQRCGLNR
jgi:hypothetical protein